MDSQGIISVYDVTKKRFTTARCKKRNTHFRRKIGQNALVFMDE